MKATKTIGMMNTPIAFSFDNNLSVELAVACNTYAKSDNTNCILDVTAVWHSWKQLTIGFY